MSHTSRNAWLATRMHANDLTSLSWHHTYCISVCIYASERLSSGRPSLSADRVALLCAAFWSKRGTGRGIECYWRGAGLWTEGRDLVVDPAKAGNMLRYVNDVECLGGRRAKNVEMVEFFDHNTLRPHSFFFTVAPVRAGRELLLDYGNVCRCSLCAYVLVGSSQQHLLHFPLRWGLQRVSVSASQV